MTALLPSKTLLNSGDKAIIKTLMFIRTFIL